MRSRHPEGCMCDRDACRDARAVRPRDEREGRQWYFAAANPYPRFGPSSAQARQRARRDADHEAEVERSIDELLARQQGPAGDPARQRLARRRALETR